MRTTHPAPTVVVGAGAAGLLAAIHAAAGSRPVVLLERTSDGGRKILISGGGRCNVLPSSLDPSRFVTASSPNTLRKILLSWPLAEQRSFFESIVGLPLALEEETGKLFPASNRARDVRDGLLRVAVEAGVEVRFGVTVREVVSMAAAAGSDDSASAGAGEPEGAHPEGEPAGAGELPTDARWLISTDTTRDIPAHSVILATGGLSVAATGSDGIGLRIARQLGHTIHDTYPALTPLTADPAVHAPLAGISLPVALAAPTERGSFVAKGGFLFTHRGYSGPSVLDISHLAVQARARVTGDGGAGRTGAAGVQADAAPGPREDATRTASRVSAEARSLQPILVQWTEHDAADVERQLTGASGGTAGAFVRRLLPQRLADALLDEAEVDPTTALSQLRKDARARLVAALTRYALPWTGDEGYKKAEVTGGGVSLAEVDPRTLESRSHPGLHLCGEMLDAFGPIGGYNFAWAFATGRLAGRAVAL